MSYMFTVSPDFTPDHLSGWYIFNTWLQKQSNTAIHLEMYDSFQAQHDAIKYDKIDLIYANPFDAAMLVREKGFLPLVKAAGISDEAIIAVNINNSVEDVSQLGAGTRVAVTEDPDVTMMGMIMLEAGDLNASNVHIDVHNTYVLVAKNLLQGKADVGIFLAEAFDGLSNLTKSQLRVLVRSQISVIHHALMIGPQLVGRRAEIQNLLLSMNDDDKGREVLRNLGFNAWESVDDEAMEFMIDLMEALAT
ncbi:MAG: phosphate/phosphite/phosphonate ABC transporter substrate-binding protein [Methylococcaceae bacterium]